MKLSDIAVQYTVEELILMSRDSFKGKAITPGDTAVISCTLDDVSLPADTYLDLVAELRLKGEL